MKAPEHAGAMKAVLTDERFSDPDWIFERKLDGVRCIAIRDGGPVRLLSRNDLPMNGRYPEIATALDGQPCTRFASVRSSVGRAGARRARSSSTARRRACSPGWRSSPPGGRARGRAPRLRG